MTNRKTYELRIVLRNGGGGELDSLDVASDDDLKRRLIQLVTETEFCAGDTISIEGSE
jgi:hypothetical protein